MNSAAKLSTFIETTKFFLKKVRLVQGATNLGDRFRKCRNH